MHAENAPKLHQLTGMPLSSVGCACDLFWMQFGRLGEISDRRGETRRVGELAVHVNIPWRISRASNILIGNRDMYFYPDGESYDFSVGGESRFHVFANDLNARLNDDPLRVESVLADDLGGLSIRLSGEYTFNAFPNVASASPSFEFWRLLAPGSDSPHLVRGTGNG